MKFAWVADTRAWPERASLRPADRRARRLTTGSVRHDIACAIRILKDAAGACRLERLGALAKRQRLARRRAQDAGFAVGHAKIGSDDDLARPVQTTVVVAELHLGRWNAHDAAVERAERDPFDELADQSSPEMGVSMNRAADGAWRTGPRFETGDTVADRPPCQAIDGHTTVRADGGGVDTRDFPTMNADHQTAKPPVRDEHVRTAAKHRDRQREAARDLERLTDLLAGSRVNQPVRRSTDLEGRYRCERHITLNARLRTPGADDRRAPVNAGSPILAVGP